MKVLSIGEVLWDVFSDREYLGGAPLNVCANLVRCGDDPALISAVGNDVRGQAAKAAMHVLGLTTEFVQMIDERPTGTASVRKDENGEPAFSIYRPAAYDAIEITPQTLARIHAFNPDWLYMGTLLQTEPSMEDLVRNLISQLPHVRCFYDMNLRPGHWNLALVERLCLQASVLKLNEIEAETLSALTGVSSEDFSLETFCATWAQRFAIDVICVTLGSEGCLIFSDGQSRRFAGNIVQVSDTVGAGDAFAAAFLHGYDQRWQIAECASFANALGALVASRPGATPAWTREECWAPASTPEAGSSK